MAKHRRVSIVTAVYILAADVHSSKPHRAASMAVV